MKVNNYYFSWQYQFKPAHTGRVQTVTTCRIKKDNEFEFHANVADHQNDEVSRSAGRKASLSKLLNILKVVGPDIFHRKFRAEIWEAYRTLTKEPRWKVKQKRGSSTSPSVKDTLEKSTQPTPTPTPTVG